MAEDIKKDVELTDEDLDLVAGGAYTKEEWEAMTTDERKNAQRRSIQAKKQNKPCEME